LRDFCSMRVMMASRFSSASGYAADEAIPPATGRAGRVGSHLCWVLCSWWCRFCSAALVIGRWSERVCFKFMPF
jgi:hypothetical protein